MHLVEVFVAWSFVILVAWSVWATVRDTVKVAKRLREIPCANCLFFTGEYLLKCTVNPSLALTEEAITCSDYCPHRNDLSGAYSR